MKRFDEEIFAGLPQCAAEYVLRVARRVGNTRRVRREVAAELADHFRDALAGVADATERECRSEQLIVDFGDDKLVARLIRRGKKRCRPLWKKAIVRSLQVVGVVILLYFVHFAWLMTLARPTIDTDYLARLNEYVQPRVDPDLNAEPLLREAMDLHVKPSDDVNETLGNVNDLTLGDLTPEQRRELAAYLAANQPAWEKFVAGSQRPYYWPTYSLPNEKQGLIGILLPSLSALRSMGREATWRSRLAMEAGDAAEAADDLLAAARVGAQLQASRATLIEQLVGMAISSLAEKPLRELAASEALSPQDLLRIQQALAGAFAGSYPTIDYRLERYCFLDITQRCFTKGGPGGGQLIPDEFRDLLDFAGAGMRDHQLLLMMASPLTAGRDATVAKAMEFYDMADRVAEMTPYEARKEDARQWVDTYVDDTSYRYPLVRMFIPSLLRASELSWRARAEREATLTIFALQRRRRDKGAYPKTLHELAGEQYIDALPQDPYSDGTLVYKPRDGGFILYSVGHDFEDNGGTTKPPLNDAWKGWNHLDGEDYIFWPPPDRPPVETQPADE